MSSTYATPPHRTKGSWTPRLVGVAVVVVLAGGILGVYLSTARSQQPVSIKHHHSAKSVKVVSVQTVGLIDFGPYDDADVWQNDSDDHPMMLIENGSAVDFALVPRSQIESGTPKWTADQTNDGGEIFIYVPTGQCLTAVPPSGAGPGGPAANGGQLRLTHCDLGLPQRWRPLHPEIVHGEPVAQYANAVTGGCLTAGRTPGPTRLARCAVPRTRAFKTQEIAFWWSA